MVKDLSKAAKALKMPLDHFDEPCSLFAVYDGHQGILCSEFVAKQFHMRLLKKLSAVSEKEHWVDEKVAEVLRECFEELDTEFLAKHRTAPDGSTAVVAFLTGVRLFVAWAGDSRCLVGRKDSRGGITAAALTVDHRPNVEAEYKRVCDAGGMVVNFGGCYRVAHVGFDEKLREMRRQEAQGLGRMAKEPVALAVSRSFGDREFKAVTGKPLLIATPGVQIVRLNSKHRFFALMCDGVLDVMSDQDAVDILGKGIDVEGFDVKAATSELVQEAYKKGSEDNLTAIMVHLLWPEGSEEKSDKPDGKAEAETNGSKAPKRVSAAELARMQEKKSSAPAAAEQTSAPAPEPAAKRPKTTEVETKAPEADAKAAEAPSKESTAADTSSMEWV